MIRCILFISILLISVFSFAINIPPECKGKNIYCIADEPKCTDNKCQTILQYNKDGDYTGYKKSCYDTCKVIRNCWCGENYKFIDEVTTLR
jgi:hypothetical protein